MTKSVHRPITSSRTSSVELSDIDERIVRFALMWRHWGGGSAGDIFVEFGISPRAYFERLTGLLNVVELSSVETEQIRAICTERLSRR